MISIAAKRSVHWWGIVEKLQHHFEVICQLVLHGSRFHSAYSNIRQHGSIVQRAHINNKLVLYNSKNSTNDTENHTRKTQNKTQKQPKI